MKKSILVLIAGSLILFTSCEKENLAFTENNPQTETDKNDIHEDNNGFRGSGFIRTHCHLTNGNNFPAGKTLCFEGGGKHYCDPGLSSNGGWKPTDRPCDQMVYINSGISEPTYTEEYNQPKSKN